MKFSRILHPFLAAITFSSFNPLLSSATAIPFGEQEVQTNKFILVASPYRHGYNLLILEQIPGGKQCWNEVGSNPIVVEPLFLNFDFTNACIRSSDGNKYSIRHNGEDLGLDYLLDVVKKDNELHLIGTPRDHSQPRLFIGKTSGMEKGSLKIDLNPEWRLTKRTYAGSTTEHIYISNSPQEELITNSTSEKAEDSLTSTLANAESFHQQLVYQPSLYPTPQPVYQSPQYPVSSPVYQPRSYQVPQAVYQPYPYPILQSVPQPVYQPYPYPVLQTAPPTTYQPQLNYQTPDVRGQY